ncbi:hypothetical protein RFI_27183 [Reticulomyxa filosa]|uniref:Methyltransferase domain-containing protein n=1 Tax=Reticulomyxa filosa TaxID=46433 RepID=X6M881_RETFI|nr:hypothetical protein RFI_27183 [Reticulomyxa filosa]|eukprot:ETO10193.1 hypothetical protein RFI_27183 [Reticulomyxa filosa]
MQNSFFFPNIDTYRFCTLKYNIFNFKIKKKTEIPQNFVGRKTQVAVLKKKLKKRRKKSSVNYKRSVDFAINKLKTSKLGEMAEYKLYMEVILEEIIPKWNTEWRRQPEMKGIINKRTLFEEIEESIPSMHCLFELMFVRIKNRRDKKNICLIDLCSGKGILSVLIVSFLHFCKYMKNGNKNEDKSAMERKDKCMKYQELYDHLKCIYLIDRNWDLPLQMNEMVNEKTKKSNSKKSTKSVILNGHLKYVTQLYQIPLIPICMNIFDITSLEHFIVTNQQVHDCVYMINAIHLCRRLSACAVSLFNQCKHHIFALLLAPCCMPKRNGVDITIGPLLRVSSLQWIHRVPSDNISPYSLVVHTLQVNDILPYRIYGIANDANYGKTFVSMRCEDLRTKLHSYEHKYHAWTSFLYNAIDQWECAKKFVQIPLHGGEHRCNMYLIASRDI